MYWFDSTLLAFLGLGALIGAWCGFVWQVARILSVGLSVTGAIHFHEPACQLLRECALQGIDDRLVRPAAYVATFLVMYLVLFYTMRVIRDIVRMADLESFDRLLGALLGATKMATLAGAVCLAMATYKSPATDVIMSKSVMAPAFADGMEAVVAMIPEDVKTWLRDNVEHLRDVSRGWQLRERDGKSAENT